MQEPHWIHLEHEGQDEVHHLVRPDRQNQTDDVEGDVNVPANSQPQLWNSSAGMKETCFEVLANEEFMGATRLLVRLACDQSLTPWCMENEDLQGGVTHSL